MTAYNIIAQAIGIAAMFFNVFSYQQNTQKKVIGFQLFGALLFTVNFFMLGAVIGGILNAICIFRALIFINREKVKADKFYWLVIFIALFVMSYILTFTVFKKPFTFSNAIIELLPVVASTLQTVAFRLNTAKSIRRFGLFCSPCWLIYNLINLAVGASICETISIISIITGIIKYDLPKKRVKE